MSLARENSMSVTDYVIDILLIVVIFRQVRPHELTWRTAVLPLLLMMMMMAAGIIYLRPVTLQVVSLAAQAGDGSIDLW
jgi:hypothetical protein